MKEKEGSEKVGFKINIQKTKILASSPISSWQIDGETVETVTDFYFPGLQNHYRWWLQPWRWKTLAPQKKSYDLPRQRFKKQRHYFANKGPSSQSYDFSSGHVWMWELDYKETECQRIVALNCGIRLLRVPWTAERSNQSVLKEISPEYSLEGLMLKLKLEYFGHVVGPSGLLQPIADAIKLFIKEPLWPATSSISIFILAPLVTLVVKVTGHVMQRTDSLEKTLMLGKIESGRRRGWQRMRWLNGITDSVDMRVWVSSGSWWWTAKPGMLQSMGSQRVGHD